MRGIVKALTSWGPFGLFALAILDSAGVPLPAAVDALLVATAAVNPKAGWLAASAAVLGSAIGSLILYYLARRGGQAYLDRAAGPERARRFREWFRIYGLVTVFIPALFPIPMPLKVFVLSAGAFGVKPLPYLLTILAARIPRYFGLAWLGMQLGPQSGGWIKHHAWQLGAAAVLLGAALAFLARQIADRRPPGSAEDLLDR